MKTRKRDSELVYAGKVPETSILENTVGAPLEPVKRFGGTKGWANMLVSGENMAALKTLLEMKREGRLKNTDGTRGVRLVYIDPPFSTNLKFKGKKDQLAYEDKLAGAEFLEFLRKRLVLLRELMAEDGSVFVHLDSKKAHHIKVVMDSVFGEENFLNDIIWSYGGRGAKHISSKFSRNHDIILWYQRSSHIFNRTFVGKRIKKGTAGFREDSDGRWFKTSPRGDYTDKSISALTKEGRVYRTKNNTVRIKYYLREDGDWLIEDKLVGDVWDDIPDAMHLGESEKTGYPTQKPEALLSRIIKTATNEGDLVLDAFAGAGTALAAAEKLGRRWVGIDSGRLAVHTIEKRLLTVKGSKEIEDPKKRYSKGPSPFTLFEAHEGGCAHCEEPLVKSDYSYDEDTDDLVIKIKKFTSHARSAKGRFKNFETLSTVMIDYDFDGEVFNLCGFFTARELEGKGYEIRFPADKARGEIMVIYSDIFGNEKWFVGEVLAHG
ncbi:MAG: site-specific DNA-methyltransferase [Deltaproteobacteria bacterium]|nr:site-specific DNA-methyltransferase [Deltaproteobacteria bacterium]